MWAECEASQTIISGRGEVDDDKVDCCPAAVAVSVGVGVDADAVEGAGDTEAGDNDVDGCKIDSGAGEEDVLALATAARIAGSRA